MHVAVNAFFWNQPHVGSGQYTRQLVYHLNRLVSDLEISLIFPRAEGDDPAEDVPPSVKVVEVPMRAGYVGKVLFEQRDFPRACKAAGADLAHVPYWGSPLQSPVPVVVTIHDMITAIFPEYHRSISAKAYNSLISASAKGAFHILTDSDASRKDIMERLKIPGEKVTTVYLAPGPEYSPEGEFLLDMAIKQKYDLPDFYVLYLGGFARHKNVELLLRAYTYAAKGLGDDYPLLLAGKKPTKVGPQFPDYDQLITDLGLEKNVRWLGYIDESDKPVIYREALSFAFPSRYEGFGLPPLEAMASNVPVVTTTAPGISEIVGDAAMAVEPNDPRALGGAIIATVIQDNLAAELKAKGRARAAEFSWEKTAAETVAVYAEVYDKTR